MPRKSGVAASYASRATRDEVAKMVENSFTIDSADTARVLGLDQPTVARLAREGSLPGVKLGGCWRFETRRIVGLVTGEAC